MARITLLIFIMFWTTWAYSDDNWSESIELALAMDQHIAATYQDQQPNYQSITIKKEQDFSIHGTTTLTLNAKGSAKEIQLHCTQKDSSNPIQCSDS